MEALLRMCRENLEGQLLFVLVEALVVGIMWKPSIRVSDGIQP